MKNTFFTLLRAALIPFMLLWAKVSMPKGIERSAEGQHTVDQECKELVLYHFSACPFCIKVRREMAKLSLPINLREARHNQENKSDLIQYGGKFQTPCLQITDSSGKVNWLYESDDIIKFLQLHFAKK